MKTAFSAFAIPLLLAGCASHYDAAGNYIDVTLPPQYTAVVTRDIALELSHRYPARTVFGFPHDPANPFSTALEKAVRQEGMGVSASAAPGYHTLGYRVARLNEHQFFISVSVSQSHFQAIWSDDDGALGRLKTLTQFEAPHE